MSSCQIDWHDDSLKQLIKRTGPTGSPDGEVDWATELGMPCHNAERHLDERTVGLAEGQIYSTGG
jgi:hypothetical protein